MRPSFHVTLAIAFLFPLLTHAVDYAGWAVGDPRDGYGTIIHTEDSGDTWYRQGSGQIANISMGGVCAVSPLEAWVVATTNQGYGTVYHTTDGGATWTRKGLGDAALAQVNLAKVHVRSNHVWAVGYGGIVHSADNGATWDNTAPPEYRSILLQGVFTVDGKTVWATGEGTNGSDFACILKTTDCGTNWTRQTGGSITQANHILGISAVNTETAWCVGGDGYLCFHTTDGGATWEKENNPGGLGDGNEVYAVNTQTVWLAIDRYIGWTHDGGAAWATQNTSPYCMGISAVNESLAWGCVVQVTHTGRVYHTSDGGTNWALQVDDGDGIASLWNISFATEPVPEPAGALLLGAVVCATARKMNRRLILRNTVSQRPFLSFSNRSMP